MLSNGVRSVGAGNSILSSVEFSDQTNSILNRSDVVLAASQLSVGVLDDLFIGVNKRANDINQIVGRNNDRGRSTPPDLFREGQRTNNLTTVLGAAVNRQEDIGRRTASQFRSLNQRLQRELS